LRERIVDVVNGLLVRNKMPTKDMITNLVHIELAFINTNHPDFVGNALPIIILMRKVVMVR
jgi:dynamin 1-like protein